jgi:hypothetical protein
MPEYPRQPMIPGPYLSGRDWTPQRQRDGAIALACRAFIYRVAAYLMVTLLDDPAMLAMAFC